MIFFKYSYNGKEREERGEFGNLTHYDYGFRVYSPSLGRFWSVDPKAAEYAGWSGYVYVMGNPLRYVDPDGKAPEDWYEDEKGNVVYDPKIKSQADLDAAGIKGKYLGQIGIGIDEKTGNKIYYLSSGFKHVFTYTLPEVVVTPEREIIVPFVDDVAAGVGEFGKRGEKLTKTKTPLKSTGKIKYYDTGWRGNQYVKTERVFSKGLTKAAKRIGKVGQAVTIGEVFIIYKNEEYQFGVKTQIEIAGAVGSIAGAEGGAILGGSIGSFIFPGVGSVVGGAIGAVLGSWGGEALFEHELRKQLMKDVKK